MKCPKCNNPPDTYDLDNKRLDSQEGSYLVCGHCGTVLRHDHGELAKPTVSELEALDFSTLDSIHLARGEVAAQMMRRGEM